MIITRAVTDYPQQANFFATLFAAAFFLCRVFFYGFGLMRSFSFWMLPDDHVQSAMLALDERKIGAIISQTVLALAYALQLMWASTIFKKAAKAMSPKKQRDPEPHLA